MGKTHNLQRGFTIIELLIVVIIIALLIGIVAVGYGAVQRNAKDTSVLSDIDAVEGAQTRYGLKNSVAGKAWYSGSGIDADLSFAPSSENVIDVVVNAGEYCIRGYNPSGNKNTIDNSFTRGSSDDACELISASVAAGGTGDVPVIAWWKFNGNTTDSSGNSNAGSNNGATLTTGASGLTSGAYLFNGSSNYMNVATTGWPSTMTDATVSFWAKPAAASNSSVAMAVTDDPSNRFSVHLPWSDNNIYFDFGNSAGTGRISLAFNAAWFNTWSYWTFTAESGVGMKIYRDGAVIASTSASGTFVKGTKTINIGYYPGLTYWSGSLDDMRVYKRALQTTEIQALYTTGAR